jgi:hypothetical protein
MRTLLLFCFACASTLVPAAAATGGTSSSTLPTSATQGAHRARSYTLPSADSREVRSAQQLFDPRHLRGRVLEDAASDLAHLGNAVVPVCVAMLVGTLPTSNWEGGAGVEYGAVAAQNLREDVVLIEALRRFEPGLVAECVADACAGKAKLDVRLVGMRILSETGDAQALDAWLEVAGGIEPMYLEGACVQGPLENALANLLRRDPAGFAALTKPSKKLPRPLLPLIVRATAASERVSGVALLLSWLGLEQALDLELLHSLPSLVEHTCGGLSEEQLSWIRPFLADDDWRVRRSAALALGLVGDARSYRELVALLDDPQRLVVQAANFALTHMSGKDLGQDSAPWLAWFEDETSWFQDSGARLIEELRSNDPATALEAARTLCQRPLFKHEIASAIAGLLTSSDPALVEGLCTALGTLGSMAGANGLLKVLDRPEEPPRRAAHAALVRLTGRKIAFEEPQRWIKALRG